MSANNDGSAATSNGDFDLLQLDSGAPTKEKPFKCDRCEAAYARQEHLDRHLRSHDGLKLHCNECGRGFARSDVLKRHQKLHERDNALDDSDSISTRKKAALARSAKACIACSSSKVKCSGDPICKRCESMNKQCEYPDPSTSKRTQKRPRASSTASAATVESLVLPPLPDFSSDQFGYGNGMPHFYNPDPTSLTVTTMPQSSIMVQQGAVAGPSNPTPAHSYGNLLDASNINFDHGQQHALSSFFDGSGAIDTGFSTTDQFSLNDFLGGMCAVSPENSGPRVAFNDFQLATDSDMFWSKFASPPNFSAAMKGPSSVGGSEAKRAEPERLMLAPGGVATRHGSPAPDEEGAQPRGENTSSWPMVWDPTATDYDLHVDATVEHTEPQSLETFIATLTKSPDFPRNVPRIDEEVRMSILESLRWGMMSDQEYHALYRTLSRIKLPLYDLLIGLYFQNFQRTYPFVHVPTFTPRVTPAPLCLAFLALGAIHCPLPGSLQLGRVLLEVARRIIESLLTKDNRLARSLPIMQTLLLWSSVRWLGSPRFMELAEVYSGPYRTGFRRMGILAEPNPNTPEGAALEQRWKAFITHEERRRTAMALFLIESEYCTLLHLPPPMSSSELKTCLPCAEDLWNAPNAEVWAQTLATMQAPLQTSAVFRLINSDTPFPLPATLKLSGFAAHVMVKSLHISIYSAHQLQAAGLGNAGDLARTSLRRALGRLGRGESEFSPVFAFSDADDSELGVEFSAARVSYHLAHIASHINLEDVDLLAGRGSSSEVTAMRTRLTGWMSSNAEAGRSVALHAGQIVLSLRHRITYGTYESSSLFYAALILYVYSRSASTSMSGSTSTPYVLDVSQKGRDPGAWIATGGPAGLDGVGSLSDSNAPARLLIVLSSLLNQVGAVWRLGQVLASVLEGMAGAEVVSALG